MKHKIRLTILTAFLLVPVLAKAGDGYSRNEVSLSYGQYSIPGLVNTFGAALGSAFQPEAGIKASIYGVVTAGYSHWFTQGFSLGCETSCELVGLQDHRSIYASLMPSVKGRWFYRPHFALYAKASAGVLFQHTSAGENSLASSGVSFAAQLTPLACEFGGQKLKGFVELGMGMEGLVLLGIRYGF